MLKNNERICHILLLLLGFFSSLQILQIFDITIFTYLLIITTLYFMVTHKIRFKGNMLKIIYIFCCMITTVLIFVNRDFIDKYVMTAVISFLNITTIFILSFSISNKSETKFFFKGFVLSCYLQLAWCLLQMILFYAFRIDLNKVIFNDLLRYGGDYSSYRDGKLVCTGLHWHAANLIPVVTFIYLKDKKIIPKLLCFAVTYYSKSATLMIAIGGCFLYSTGCFVLYLLGNPKIKISKSSVVLSTIVIILVIFNINFIYSKVSEMVIMLFNRFLQINNTAGGTSSAVHFSYYESIPDIFSKISGISMSFGVGMSSSGIVFSSLYNQYTDMIWVVESDFVNILLSQGIIGFTLFYAILGGLYFKIRKANKRLSWYILVLFVCGVTYNVQFYWVVLIELLLATYVSNNSINTEVILEDNNAIKCDRSYI